MNAPKALVPTYMLDFKCIGSECEDSCCIGWKVRIDKKTYNNLTSIPQKALREKLKNGMERLEPSNRTNEHFAQMEMDRRTGCCSMLDEQKLCTIQRSLGERYLAPICATYPRNIFWVNNEQEISAVMSCPEVARLALLNPEKMEFTYTEPMVQANAQIKERVTTQYNSSFMNFFWEIRIFAIEIIQNRQFSFSHRLILLGLFCEQLQQLINQNLEDETNVKGLIEKFKVIMDDDEVLQDYDTFPADHEFQFITLNNIISKNLGNIGSDSRFASCVQDYLEGLNEQKELGKLVDLVSFYQNGYLDYYKPFMDDHEFIFENYAVNYIYSHLFPKSEKRNVYRLYTILVSHYTLLKLLLIGISIKNKGLTKDEVIKVVQSFTKTAEHTNVYVENIIEFLEDEKYEAMGYLCLLIKN
ncbi:lysine-N-methylase [Paenibacillus sp. OK060]|uniref:flagellin lysine-N-methylase n=1 Tax=Paenibacillus sp. OK060 TaxID=1881034 RepID=UPI00088190CA|nr:flagellin lysine-N-methylase [Paenibacillus sp. OK060]SDK86975.1 lysine-N-methylase [Paenibacillus sp. OK060]